MPTGCMAYYFSLSRMPTGRMLQELRPALESRLAGKADKADKAPVRLLEPASRAPEMSKIDEAGEESEDEQEANSDGEPPEKLDFSRARRAPDPHGAW